MRLATRARELLGDGGVLAPTSNEEPEGDVDQNARAVQESDEAERDADGSFADAEAHREARAHATDEGVARGTGHWTLGYPEGGRRRSGR